MSTQKTLHEALKLLHKAINLKKTEQPIWFCPNYGICANIENILQSEFEPLSRVQRSKLEKLIQKLFMKWPDFSGDVAFPINTVKCIKGVEEFTDAMDSPSKMWGKHQGNKYGQARRRLLTFLIKETK